MKGFKAIYGILAFIALLALISPFARLYPAGMFWAGVTMAASYACGVWGVIAWRDRRGTVIFMKNSIRKSRASGVIAKTTESPNDKIPGLALLPFGGFTSKLPPFTIADHSCAIVPTSSIEELSELTTLVYSQIIPLKAKHLMSLMSPFAKLAESSPFLSYLMKKKTRSEAFLGVENALLGPMTTEHFLTTDEIINSLSGSWSRQKAAREGPDAKDEWLEASIKSRKKSPPIQKAKKFIFGEPRTETEEDRPDQREPN